MGTEHTMAKIGIFWIFKGAIFGKAVRLDAGVEGVPGVIDSPDNHADVWDLDRPWAPRFPELSGVEYQDVPRGRVLYLADKGVHLVYLDKSLMTTAGRLLICELFEISAGKSQWRSDVHYTTSRREIDQLFCGEAE